MKTMFLANWNLMRLLRLMMGLLAAAQALAVRDPLIGLISVVFLYQALANVSCCGMGGACPTSINAEAKQKAIENASFEEVN